LQAAGRVEHPRSQSDEAASRNRELQVTQVFLRIHPHHLAAPAANGILISCGNLRSFEAIEALETDTGLAVVTSNQAGLWQALRMAGINDRLRHIGRLLNDH
jgi:maleate cis-trans isomerase